MKRRWKILGGIAGALVALALIPIAYIELGCAPSGTGMAAAPYKSVMPNDTGKRPEARTWLTYPEWYIVYSAESYGAYLASGKAPSGFSYGRQITGFWSGLCAVNRAAGSGEAGDAKLMLYTIGLSHSAEMAVKGLYENVVGRFSEWFGGWRSENDVAAARVWQRYGAFMHETPWYKFPFGDALGEFWATNSWGAIYRNFERRGAFTAEYAVKAGYAGLIGLASDATLDAAQPTLPFVARGTPRAIAAIDARLKPRATIGSDMVVVEAPRYAQFTELLKRMSQAGIELVEIAGNDDILVTVLKPARVPMPRDAAVLFSEALDDRPGWQRVGLAVKIPRLLPLMRETGTAGGIVEHVYDY